MVVVASFEKGDSKENKVGKRFSGAQEEAKTNTVSSMGYREKSLSPGLRYVIVHRRRGRSKLLIHSKSREAED